MRYYVRVGSKSDVLSLVVLGHFLTKYKEMIFVFFFSTHEVNIHTFYFL